MRWTDHASLVRFVVSSQQTALCSDPRGNLEKASHRHETCLPNLYSRSRSEPCRFDFFPLHGPRRDNCSAERPTDGIESNCRTRCCACCITRCCTGCADCTSHAFTSGPLQMALPINLEAGPLGKYALNGAVSGIGVFQNNAVPGNNPQEGAFSNAMIFFQKTNWLVSVLRSGGRLRRCLPGVAFHFQRHNQQRPLGPGARGLRETGAGEEYQHPVWHSADADRR